jgi:hypothetical protein
MRAVSPLSQPSFELSIDGLIYFAMASSRNLSKSDVSGKRGLMIVRLQIN